MKCGRKKRCGEGDRETIGCKGQDRKEQQNNNKTLTECEAFSVDTVAMIGIQTKQTVGHKLLTFDPMLLIIPRIWLLVVAA